MPIRRMLMFCALALALGGAAIFHVRPYARRLRAGAERGSDARAMRARLRRMEAADEGYDARYARAAPARPPGVALSFDDWEVDNWHRFFTRADVRAYGPRVTFFISHPYRLTDAEWARLRELEALGHEIGCHGHRHLRSTRYARAHGVESYVQDEILPALDAMARHGFTEVKSFAYPCGVRSRQMDEVLFGHFSVLRGTGMRTPEDERADPRRDFRSVSPNQGGKKVLWAHGLDDLLRHRMLERRVFPLIREARRRGRVVLLYGHNITDDPGYVAGLPEGDPRKECTVWHEDVKRIVQFASESGTRFYTMGELD